MTELNKIQERNDLLIKKGFDLIFKIDKYLGIEDEYFRPVKDYVHEYKISNKGNVANVKTGRILKQAKDSHGYFKVILSKNGKPTTNKIHRLLAEAFLVNDQNKPCIDHIDNNKSNNNLNNLRFATFQENNRNASISKRNKSGVKGVCFDQRSNKWIAYIRINGKAKHIGYFKNKEEAQLARKEYSHDLHGNFVNKCEK